jgi:hypothetical protein
MAWISDISFLDVCLSLIAVGLLERVFLMLPDRWVSPGGRLLDKGSLE